MQSKFDKSNEFPEWLAGALNRGVALKLSKLLSKKRNTEIVCRFLQAHSHITRINLSMNHAGSTFDALMPGFAACALLRSIDLSVNKITDERMEALTDALKFCAELKVLIFAHNCIGNRGAKALATLVAKNLKLRKLNLQHNKIGGDGAAALSLALRRNDRIYLELGHNAIGPGGAKVLSNDLLEKKISRFLLHANTIADEGLLALSVPLQMHPTITHLNLSNNNLSIESAGVLRFILEKNPYLLFINISANELGSSQAMQELVNGLKVNTILKSFIMSRNVMEEESVFLLGSAIEKHPTLCELGLAYNQISDRGSTAIGNILQYNSALKHLDLRGNVIEYGQPLAMGLKANQTLEILNLSQNLLCDAAVQFIAQALKSHPTLKIFSMMQTQVGTCGIFALAEALQENRSLMSLTLSSLPLGAEAPGIALLEAFKTHEKLGQIHFSYNGMSESLKGKFHQAARHKVLKPFMAAILVLARDSARNSLSLWGMMPQELKEEILDFFCLEASCDKASGKCYMQFLSYAKFVFEQVGAINQHIAAKAPIKIVERKSSAGQYLFSFFPVLAEDLNESQVVGYAARSSSFVMSGSGCSQ